MKYRNRRFRGTSVDPHNTIKYVPGKWNVYASTSDIASRYQLGSVALGRGNNNCILANYADGQTWVTCLRNNLSIFPTSNPDLLQQVERELNASGISYTVKPSRADAEVAVRKD